MGINFRRETSKYVYTISWGGETRVFLVPKFEHSLARFEGSHQCLWVVSTARNVVSCDRGKKPWHQQLFGGVDGPRPQNVSCSLNQHPKPEESDYPLISAPTTSVIKLRTSFLFHLDHLGPSNLSYFPKNFPIFQAVSGRIPPRSQPPHPQTAGPVFSSSSMEDNRLMAGTSFV